jgi:hypothetical protein
MRRRYATVLRTQCHAAWASHALFWLPSMRGSVKGMARRCLRVRRRRSVSTSFVRLDAPRRHLGRAAGWQRLRGPWAVTLAWVAVASGVRVREVADPKCRCPGTGRPRWMTKTPRGALPGSRFPGSGSRLRAAGRRHRTGAAAGSASLPWGSSWRRACAGSSRGLQCRGAAGRSRAISRRRGRDRRGGRPGPRAGGHFPAAGQWRPWLRGRLPRRPAVSRSPTWVAPASA